MLLKRNFKNSFTLLEMLVVLIILAIIISFVVPAYINAQRKAKDQEAKAFLELIQVGQKAYRLDYGEYAVCSDNAECNEVLDLDLPYCDSSDDCDRKGAWHFTVQLTDDGFTANADGRNKIGTGNWEIDQDDNCTHRVGADDPPGCNVGFVPDDGGDEGDGGDGDGGDGDTPPDTDAGGN